MAEGAEEVKGNSSIPLAKAMADCMVCYGMNGEALRPQHYMTYDDYGHISADPKAAALTEQIGPKSVITFPSGGQQLPGRGFYEISGLAWSGAGAVRRALYRRTRHATADA